VKVPEFVVRIERVVLHAEPAVFKLGQPYAMFLTNVVRVLVPFVEGGHKD
jgi:hypothetical protein